MQPTLPSSPGCPHEIRNVCKGLGQSCTQQILVATHPTVSWLSCPDKGMGTLPCNGKPSGVTGRKATSVIRTVAFISRQRCAQVTWRKAGPQRGRIPRYLLAVSFAHRLLLSSLNKILNLDAEATFTAPTWALCYFPRTTGRRVIVIPRSFLLSSCLKAAPWVSRRCSTAAFLCIPPRGTSSDFICLLTVSKKSFYSVRILGILLFTSTFGIHLVLKDFCWLKEKVFLLGHIILIGV